MRINAHRIMQVNRRHLAAWLCALAEPTGQQPWLNQQANNHHHFRAQHAREQDMDGIANVRCSRQHRNQQLPLPLVHQRTEIRAHRV